MNRWTLLGALVLLAACGGREAAIEETTATPASTDAASETAKETMTCSELIDAANLAMISAYNDSLACDVDSDCALMQTGGPSCAGFCGGYYAQNAIASFESAQQNIEQTFCAPAKAKGCWYTLSECPRAAGPARCQNHQCTPNTMSWGLGLGADHEPTGNK